MLCPVCDGKLVVVDVRQKSPGVVKRKYECPNRRCDIKVTTTEKINYENLSRQVLDKLHDKVSGR